MKKIKFFIYFVMFFMFLFILTGCTNNENDNSNDSSGTRTSLTLNNENTNSTTNNSVNENSEPTPTPLKKEEEISSFSTKILDDSSGRLKNISITCSTLNNTIIKDGETFSFNNVVGKPTSDRGYKEAKIIKNHRADKGIGGGNCQVSSTLYNAVLNVPGLSIVERHDHGGKSVGYVPVGKDAAISYGSLDLKFKNNYGNNIKILATSDNKNITIKINKVP